MATRRDVLKVVPAVALAAVAASLPEIAEAKASVDEPVFAIRTMVLVLGSGDAKSSMKETAPGSNYFVPYSQLIRSFKAACDAFWQEHPKGVRLIPGDKMSLRFYKEDGTLWGQEHNMEADVIEVVGKGRYEVINFALQLLRREVNQSRRAQGLEEVAGYEDVHQVTVEFRFEAPPSGRP
jgi:hypothetical protein